MRFSSHILGGKPESSIRESLIFEGENPYFCTNLDITLIGNWDGLGVNMPSDLLPHHNHCEWGLVHRIGRG